jgi:hypothetical protein
MCIWWMGEQVSAHTRVGLGLPLRLAWALASGHSYVVCLEWCRQTTLRRRRVIVLHRMVSEYGYLSPLGGGVYGELTLLGDCSDFGWISGWGDRASADWGVLRMRYMHVQCTLLSPGREVNVDGNGSG